MATERTVAIRGGAVSFRVLSAGAGPPVVYFHEQAPEELRREVEEYIITGGYPTGDPRATEGGLHEQASLVERPRERGGQLRPGARARRHPRWRRASYAARPWRRATAPRAHPS